MAVCNGDLGTKEHYRGELKGEPLRAFLQSFAGSQRCASMVKLDASTDFSKLKTGQLKQLLKDRGVTCLECIEKNDYVSRLKELIAGLK